MNNYKLIIQYDGTEYSGWQTQLNSSSVQETIQKTIAIVTNEEVNLVGSGRTDSGVHALGQTANFRINLELDLYKFRYQLNSILPKDIAITFAEKTDYDFHARFDARKRSYLFFFYRGKSPFWYRYSAYLNSEVDIQQLNKLSRVFLGVHDYSSFARKNTETENKVCNVYDAWWKQQKDLIIFYIEADRFLHGMVRTITGTLLNAVKNNLQEKYLLSTLENKDRESAGEAAPAKGLFLYKVKY